MCILWYKNTMLNFYMNRLPLWHVMNSYNCLFLILFWLHAMFVMLSIVNFDQGLRTHDYIGYTGQQSALYGSAWSPEFGFQKVKRCMLLRLLILRKCAKCDGATIMLPFLCLCVHSLREIITKCVPKSTTTNF